MVQYTVACYSGGTAPPKMKDLTAKCEHDITHGIAVTERWIKDYMKYI